LSCGEIVTCILRHRQ